MFTVDTGLTQAQMREHAPAIFAEAPHQSRSDKYQFISTKKILGALRLENFIVTGVQQQPSRTGDSYTATHLVQLRHITDIGKSRGSIQTLNILGNHRGEAGYSVRMGRYVLACSNRLFMGQTDAIYQTKHRGDIIDQVLTGTFKVMRASSKYERMVERMQKTFLNYREQYEYAALALSLRGEPGKSFTPYDLLHARRDEDRGDALWQVFNRVQENVLKGIQVQTQDGHKHTLKSINAIDRNIDINAVLWNEAQKRVAHA